MEICLDLIVARERGIFRLITQCLEYPTHRQLIIMLFKELALW